MGNFFSVRILGVDGGIWVINQQKIRVRNAIQRKTVENMVTLEGLPFNSNMISFNV
jgi:hypothetical protein